MTTDRYPQFSAFHAHARTAAIVGHEKARLSAEQLRRDMTGERRRLVLPSEAVEALTAAGVSLHQWREMGFQIEGEQGR